MKNAVAYYRVSSAKQGASGLGLEAQQQLVESHAQRNEYNVIASFTEVESGTKKGVRPKLSQAIDFAKANDATLLIAKLDRLSRNPHFLTGLMESGIDFVACDMPVADSFSIHIIAAVAQREAELISGRTKDALAAAKRRGVLLGKPENLTAKARLAGAAANRARAHSAYKSSSSHARLLRQQGLSYKAVADELNRLDVPTRSGKAWTAMLAHRVINKYA